MIPIDCSNSRGSAPLNRCISKSAFRQLPFAMTKPRRLYVSGAGNDHSFPRKASKPLMEKRRRQRINRALEELKLFVAEPIVKDQNISQKLEKADILDLTVKFVQECTRHSKFGQQIQPHQNWPPHTPWLSFMAGYAACEAVLRSIFLTNRPLNSTNSCSPAEFSLLVALDDHRNAAASRFETALSEGHPRRTILNWSKFHSSSMPSDAETVNSTPSSPSSTPFSIPFQMSPVLPCNGDNFQQFDNQSRQEKGLWRPW